MPIAASAIGAFLVIIPYQQEIKREQSEHLISPDMVTTESLSAQHGDCAADGFWSLLYHLDCRLDGDTRQMPIAASAIGAFLVIIPYPHAIAL